MSTSTSYPKTRGLPLSAPSPTELKRLRAKLAFYEQPITVFDRPVENDPREAARKRHQERLVEKAIQAQKQAKEREGPLARIARRLKRVYARWSASLRASRKKGDGFCRGGGISDELHASSGARVLSPGGVELDEGTRFRLQLAGLHLHSAHMPHQQTVATL